MSEFASLTVPQLKEKLKERNLPTDGKKADLLARLSEAGADVAEKEEEVPQETTESTEPQPETQPETQPESVPAAETVDAPIEAEATNGAEEEKPAQPEKKVLTPEERKQLAVDLLTKKIKRAEKFGDETSATAAKKDLARVEKFGVDPSTALAKELGLLDNSVNSELNNRPQRKGQKKGKKGKGNGKVQKQ